MYERPPQAKVHLGESLSPTDANSKCFECEKQDECFSFSAMSWVRVLALWTMVFKIPWQISIP